MKRNVEAQKAFSAFVVFEPCHEGLSETISFVSRVDYFSKEALLVPVQSISRSGFYDNSMSCIILNET